jgi:hypothetical protein
MTEMNVFDIENQRLIAKTRSHEMKARLWANFEDDCFDCDGHLCIEGEDIDRFYEIANESSILLDFLAGR